MALNLVVFEIKYILLDQFEFRNTFNGNTLFEILNIFFSFELKEYQLFKIMLKTNFASILLPIRMINQ